MQPAAIFIWRLAICAQGLSGRWRYAHSKLPLVYAKHVNISFNEFESFFSEGSCAVLNIIYAFPFIVHTRDPGFFVGFL